MRITHKFYGSEVITSDEEYFVDGEVSYSIEDGSIGLVPYGDTLVDAGGGPVIEDIKVFIGNIVEADDMELPLTAKDTCHEFMENYFSTYTGEEELLDACKP